MKLFGTFSGVFVPSFEALFGAVLFLILPGLTAQVGFVSMALIIILANSVTVATAFSIGDCASNLENIGAGGMYAIAKRSLGKAFGGAIGIQLYLAQAVSIGFYAIGFAYPLQPLLAKIPALYNFFEQNGITALQQKQIIATIIGFVAFLSGLAGANFVSKLQLIIFVILSVSVSSIMFAPALNIAGPEGPVFSKGIEENLPSLGFIVAFAIFFPAVTGIDAGVGMSGSLKDPRKSLANGTFLAIAVTGIGYLLVSYVFSLVNPKLILQPIIDAPGAIPRPSANSAEFLFQSNSVISFLILIGILFATGSSALAYFLTAPMTLQALTSDNMLPKFLSFLGKDFRKNGREPRWATVLTFIIIIPVIWSGSIEFASQIVGICFLVVYGWINLAAFFERVSGNPSFRPTSKGHWAISLYGFLLTIIIIMIFNPLLGLIVFATQLGVFLLLLKYKSNNQIEGVWWGLAFSLLVRSFKRMKRIIQGSKNWRPVVGFFSFADKEEESASSLEISRWISYYKGISLINFLSQLNKEEEIVQAPEEYKLVNVKGKDFDGAIMSIVQASMPGALQMNTVFLPIDSRLNLVSLISDLIAVGKNVLLFKSGNKSSLKSDNRVDVWWKGEENGNLMALLSYIITQSDREEKRKKRSIRLIRKIDADEDKTNAEDEMRKLMSGARLNGEILVLPDDDGDIHDTMREHSKDASLVLIGMPGKKSSGIAKIFSLDELFFSRQLHKFDDFPPVLFVKAADTMGLIE